MTINKVSTAEPSLRIQKPDRFSILKNLDNFMVFVLLAITIWIAYFWHSASFGLYWEDRVWMLNAIETTWSEAWHELLKIILTMHQGRPLQSGLIHLLSFIGFKLGGLHVVYWIAYAILTVNSFLFYTLLKRVFNQEVFAVTGALGFCLFPGYTVQILLTLALSVQPSLMFFLIASHCYLSGRKKLSYLFILATLFCYELFFPIFLAVPLLKKKWDSKIVRELFRHALVMAALFLLVLIIRKVMGVNRVADLSIVSALKTSIWAMIFGPITTMKTFLYRPLETLEALAGRERNMELWLFLPLYFVGLVWALSRLKLKTSIFFKDLLKPALVGSIVLVLAYSLALVGPIKLVDDVGSRIHSGAIVGASILCACIGSSIMYIGKAYGKRRLATLLLAAYFSLLLGFGLSIQRDYALAWQYHSSWLSDIIKLVPDITDGSVILFEEKGLKSTKYIRWFQDADRTILSALFQFPNDWENPPIIVPLKDSWQAYSHLDNNLNLLYVGNPLNPSDTKKFKSTSIVFLEPQNGNLTRRVNPMIIGDQTLKLKNQSEPIISTFDKKPLYNYMIQSPDEEPINYIQ